MDLQSLVDPVIKIAHNAGEELLKFYKSDYKTENKADGSIVTEADFASDKVIREQLAKLTPNIPIVTEETIENFKNTDLSDATYWCVDPLDGTAVFESNRSEFCVLIGLIKNKRPVLGIAHFPALDKTAYATKGNQAFIINKNQRKKLLITQKGKKLPTLIYKKHLYLKETYKLAEKFNFQTIVQKDTALQFVAVAEEEYNAFCYAKESAREWDIAANQIILEEAGGILCNKDGNNILYGFPYKNKTSAVGLCHPDLVKYLK